MINLRRSLGLARSLSNCSMTARSSSASLGEPIGSSPSRRFTGRTVGSAPHPSAAADREGPSMSEMQSKTGTGMEYVLGIATSLMGEKNKKSIEETSQGTATNPARCRKRRSARSTGCTTAPKRQHRGRDVPKAYPARPQRMRS